MLPSGKAVCRYRTRYCLLPLDAHTWQFGMAYLGFQIIKKLQSLAISSTNLQFRFTDALIAYVRLSTTNAVSFKVFKCCQLL